MSKEIVYDEEALTVIGQGVTLLAKAVKSTYGPAGRHVAIGENGTAFMTKDGATVAESISLKGALANMGAQLLRQAATRTAMAAGDGSTTTVVLAERMIIESMKAVAAGLSPLHLKEGLLGAHRAVQEDLERMSRPVTDLNGLKNLAAVYLPNDTQLSDLVAMAYQQSGKDTIVEIAQARSVESSLHAVAGTEVAAGLLSPYLATEASGDTAVYEDALVLITDQKLDSVSSIVPLLTKTADAGKPLLLIAREVAPEVLAMLVSNKQRGGLQVVAVKPSLAGSRLNGLLEDLALLSGTEVISSEKGQLLQHVTLEQLGHAEKVTVTQQHTRLQFTARDNADAEKERLIARLRTTLSKTEDTSEKAALESRLKTLTGSFAQVLVGAHTETELRDKMQRAQGAAKALRAALEEGVVPGGGIAFLDANWMVIRQQYDSNAARIGANIMLAALEAPFTALAENAGLEPLPLIGNLHQSELGTGYDLRSSKVTNMWQACILDPTKVTRLALENAVSVVSELISTSAAMYEEAIDTK